MASGVIQADIDEVNARKARCRAQFNKDEFVNTMKSFYNLLIRMGFWPENCLEARPGQSSEINTTLARSLGYTDACIDLMQKIPYPNDKVVYDHELRLLEDSAIVDLRKEDDLRAGRSPDDVGFDEFRPVDGWILPLMSMHGHEGWVVLLDVELGAIYQYQWMYGPSSDLLEYHVQRHLEGKTGGPDHRDLPPFTYRYCSFTPATQYFQELHSKYYSLKRLPFMNPRVENDVDSNLERYFRNKRETSNCRREQTTIIRLYKETGWPGESFDRAEFLNRWADWKELSRHQSPPHTSDDENADECNREQEAEEEMAEIESNFSTM